MSQTDQSLSGYVVLMSTPRLGGGAPLLEGFFVLAQDSEDACTRVVQKHGITDLELRVVKKLSENTVRAPNLRAGEVRYI